MNIQQKKEDRFKFLHKLYEVSSGRTGLPINGEVIGSELGFDRTYSIDIYHYLNDEMLTEPMGAGLRLSLTHHGLTTVEDALEMPNKATTYFPPVNIININEMHGGAIQQGTHNSTISIISKDVINGVNEYIETLDKFINDNIENVELKNELKADVETLKQQLQSPKPKSSIIKATLSSTKEVLIGAAGGILGTMATPKAQELIQVVQELINKI